jgi:hypothetical protein
VQFGLFRGGVVEPIHFYLEHVGVLCGFCSLGVIEPLALVKKGCKISETSTVIDSRGLLLPMNNLVPRDIVLNK